MAIKRIKVSNFKTFKDLDVQLGHFNVVIGANASGKSNFTEVFKFLNNIQKDDLRDAISISGGLDSIRNLKLASSVDLEMEVVSDTDFAWGIPPRGLRIYETTYRFAIHSDQSKTGYRIGADSLTQKFRFVKLEEKQGKLFEDPIPLEGGTLIISRENGKLKYYFDPPDIEKQLEEASLPFPPAVRLLEQQLPASLLLIRTRLGLIPPWESLLGGLGIYDIDPRIAKKPAQVTAKAELQYDAENLAIVLNNIIADHQQKRKFCNLVKDLLPFVDDVGTEQVAKSLLVRLRENYYADTFLRAYLLSDGTINIAALITALYFEQKELVIIEEPERNVHPHLISGLLDMMKDASKKKQVIVTTHSPQVVKHAGLENLLFVSRDKEGFSSISRPREKHQVKVFLENELGLDELFIDNLLGD